MGGGPTGITIDRWGPSAWNTLHAFAHTSPLAFTDEDRTDWEVFLYAFARRLPCPRCREHFEAHLDAHLHACSLSGRQDLVVFLHEAHNAVSARLGKRTWTLNAHMWAYSRRRAAAEARADRLSAAVLLATAAFLLARRRRRKE